LIEAHATIRPIQKVKIWGRNFKKAKQLAKQFDGAAYEVIAVENLQEAITDSDIISAATMSEMPLIKGEWLKPGQHIDLVGSYLPNLREADDEVIRRSTIYVDNLTGALKETGDIVIPIETGVLKKENIAGDLFQICKNSAEFLRKEDQEITLFKSVGHALEDLATASYLFQKISSQKK